MEERLQFLNKFYLAVPEKVMRKVVVKERYRISEKEFGDLTEVVQDRVAAIFAIVAKEAGGFSNIHLEQAQIEMSFPYPERSFEEFKEWTEAFAFRAPFFTPEPAKIIVKSLDAPITEDEDGPMLGARQSDDGLDTTLEAECALDWVSILNHVETFCGSRFHAWVGNKGSYLRPYLLSHLLFLRGLYNLQRLLLKQGLYEFQEKEGTRSNWIQRCFSSKEAYTSSIEKVYRFLQGARPDSTIREEVFADAIRQRCEGMRPPSGGILVRRGRPVPEAGIAAEWLEGFASLDFTGTWDSKVHGEAFKHRVGHALFEKSTWRETPLEKAYRWHMASVFGSKA